jgi:hypothetical protein
MWLVWLVLVGIPASHADEPEKPAQSLPLFAQIEFAKPLGVEHFQLDHETRMTGWKLGERWYLGRQRGEDSGLTLVWQKQRDQLSFSKDGLRFTRRF